MGVLTCSQKLMEHSSAWVFIMLHVYQYYYLLSCVATVVSDEVVTLDLVVSFLENQCGRSTGISTTRFPCKKIFFHNWYNSHNKGDTVHNMLKSEKSFCIFYSSNILSPTNFLPCTSGYIIRKLGTLKIHKPSAKYCTV